MPDETKRAVKLLATALDNLCARINQTLPTDGNYISFDDPGLEDAVNGLVAYSDECSSALDDPTVRAAFAASEAS